MSNKNIAIITAVVSFLVMSFNQNILFGVLSVGFTYVLFEIMCKIEQNGSFSNYLNEFISAVDVIYTDDKNKAVGYIIGSLAVISFTIFAVNFILPNFISISFCMLCVLKGFAYFTNKEKAF